MPYRWRVMFVNWLFDWAGPWHISGASVILPFAAADFSVSTTTIVWFIIIYSISTATCILPAAYLGNILGRRRMVILGAFLDMASQIGIFFAPSIAWLIPIRSLGGLGNACILANLPSLVVEVFPHDQRGKALGIMALGVGIGAVFTSPLAGALADTLGWRYLYLLTGFLYFVLFLLAIVVVKESRTLSKEKVSLRRFDYPGVLLVGAFLVLLTLGMQRFSHSSTIMLAFGMVTVAVFAAFAFVTLELRSPYPLVDPRLFKNKGLSRAVLRGVLVTLVMSTDRFLIPFYLIQGVGWSGSFTGTVLIAQSVAQPIFAPVAGYLVDRLGPVKPLIASMVLMVVGGILLVSLGSHPSVLHVTTGLFIRGVGMGLFMTPNRHEVFSSVPQDKLSLAQAVSGLTGHGAGTVGSSAAATLLGVFLAQNFSVPEAYRDGTIITLVVFAAGSIAIPLVLRSQRAPSRAEAFKAKR